jgi:quercetin dioxygenase-like cupin family protein
VLDADDLAWVRGPATLERVEKTVPVVLRIVLAGGPGGHPLIVRKTAAHSYPIAGGKGSVTLFLDGSGEPIAVDLLTAAGGVKIPPHVHAGSEELIYVVAGKGMTTIDGKPVFSGSGSLLRIPAGVEHSLAVDEPLTAVQVYSPAGPEQRFKSVSPK